MYILNRYGEYNTMELQNIEITRDTHEYLKARIKAANPSMNVDWNDFQLEIKRPQGSASGKVVMSITSNATTKYKNPEKVVEFTYRTSDTIEEILYTEVGIPRNPDYQDAEVIKTKLEEFKRNPYSIINGITLTVEDAYKTAEGEYVDSYGASEVSATIDPTAKLITVMADKSHGSTVSETNKGSAMLSASILPLTTKDQDYFFIVCKEQDEATLDFDAEGTDITNNSLDISMNTLRKQG